MGTSLNHHDKKLGILAIFSIASGAMISSGLFVLPSVIYKIAGPGIIISYLIAGIMLIPAMLSNTELATAMPKSGGTYFYVNRSIGPLMGTFAGFADWFAISLKGAFALIGMGSFLQLFFPEVTLFQIKLFALSLIIIFVLLNLSSLKESSRAQVVMVIGLLGILVFFIVSGFYNGLEESHFTPLMPKGWSGIIQAAGMVFISFGGLTKVAALAGETINPVKTIPKGIFLSFFVVITIYVAAVSVSIGLIDGQTLSNSYTPLSVAAKVSTGDIGMILLSLGALLSFATTANAAIMSASRIPFAMSEDGILPEFLSKTSKKHGIPWVAVLATGIFMAVVIVVLDLKDLVKVASTMLLLLFFLVNIAVILMHESHLVTYKPEFKAPAYPVLQILGMIASIFLIVGMGMFPIILAGAFFILTLLWYFIFARGKLHSNSALIHIVERVTDKKISGTNLHSELKDILRERDNIIEDRFDKLINEAEIIDIKEEVSIDRLFEEIAKAFTKHLNLSKDDIIGKLQRREETSTTAITPGLAIPHIVYEGDVGFEIVVVRVREGVNFSVDAQNVKMIFALAGAAKERNFHLKALMSIAQIVQSPDFENGWKYARSEEELRSLILVTKRQRGM